MSAVKESPGNLMMSTRIGNFFPTTGEPVDNLQQFRFKLRKTWIDSFLGSCLQWDTAQDNDDNKDSDEDNHDNCDEDDDDGDDDGNDDGDDDGRGRTCSPEIAVGVSSWSRGGRSSGWRQ